MDSIPDEAQESTDYVVSDTGPFALVPEWVLDAEVSDRAVRLYAALARYADVKGLAWPRRSVLAKRLRCSTKSVDRALDELEELEAVRVVPYFDEGGQRSNRYHLRRACPDPSSGVSRGPGHEEPAPLDSSVAQNENQGTRTREEESVRPDVLALAQLLADLMVANGCRTPTVTKTGFLDPIRLLIDKDGIEAERVERAIRWALADEFWRGNIHSGKALRKNYDKLREAAKREGVVKPAPVTGGGAITRDGKTFLPGTGWVDVAS